ncbi:hypothetical protein AgCh_000510 [Apium graveolens]
MYVIEFQKRGLPYAHMLIWLHPDDHPNTIEQFDDLVCAEIPHKETDPAGYNAVKNYMIHGPCGQDFSYSPYMSDGKCGRYFAKRHFLRNVNNWKGLREYKEACELRSMFVHILTNCPVADPLKLWTDNWKFLCDDILYNKRKKSGNVELKLSDADLENYTLVEVEKLLNGVGKSLKDFTNMSYPEDIYMHSTTNRLIEEETGYDKNQQFEELSKNFQSFNSEQL